MPRAPSFREIEVFRAVMLSGTTTAAAAMLHTTQPSVSRVLAQMQTGTDLKLFDMEKGRLRPTPEAQRLFETVQGHFQGLARIGQEVHLLRRSGTGLLRLGCTPTLGLGPMPGIVARFIERHPDVSVDLQTVGSHQLGEGLLHGRFDLVLATGRLDHPQFDIRVMHRSPAVCVMHPGHVMASRRRIRAADLSGQRLLTLNADDELSVALWQALQEAGAEPAATLQTTYSSTICRLAAEGAGIGIVNPYAARVFGQALMVVPLVPAIAVEVRLAHAGHLASSRLTEVFASLVAEGLEA
ncbi:DNA-binding transcriptional LysR family regulator [Cupriavidus metallidurans]|jgi:DNA-binding transcriptional LysR family regulator|uniref:LysR substrate-binding domain-containing protein n=1 Tax=Cupriavidus TaxID=106589 RepID=UPI00049392D5|nr:LysR substrate-binding domain-containing protein [Cupriavidus metallidurans]KWW39205.1 HTH-type transcriptional regulator CynR [Cupriavidus metallidurans]MDE4920425.1 LysR substrate-binding domain-containing protein [Cupriavidus metallidurans]